jgi:predicted  nucleic acid-binding Zn-ribbon protein
VTSVDAASRRLCLALDALDAAVEERHRTDSAVSALQVEIELLTTDRARLADELDQARERLARLERVNLEVSRRLDAVLESIHRVIESEAGQK